MRNLTMKIVVIVTSFFSLINLINLSAHAAMDSLDSKAFEIEEPSTYEPTAIPPLY